MEVVRDSAEIATRVSRVLIQFDQGSLSSYGLTGGLVAGQLGNWMRGFGQLGACLRKKSMEKFGGEDKGTHKAGVVWKLDRFKL